MYRLVIADDEPLIGVGLCQLNDWHSLGFEVVALFEDGAEVLSYLENNSADALLLDICMFQVSGLEVAAIVREKYPNVKVVLLSGYQEFEYAREAMKCGVYEYLLKPVEEDKLRDTFSKIRYQLDEIQHEALLLSSFSVNEYELLLEILRSMTQKNNDSETEQWQVYAKFRRLFPDMPDEMQTNLVRKLINQVDSLIQQKNAKLAKHFERELHTISKKGENIETRRKLVSDLLLEWQDIVILNDLAVSNRPDIDERIYLAKKYIARHLSNDFGYGDVAEFVNVSPRHFIRLFRSETGETFTSYVVRMRIEAAKKLLLESELEIKDIHAAVGYHDEKYFQRLFKNQVGCSMWEYRNLSERK